MQSSIAPMGEKDEELNEASASWRHLEHMIKLITGLQQRPCIRRKSKYHPATTARRGRFFHLAL